MAVQHGSGWRAASALLRELLELRPELHERLLDDPHLGPLLQS